MRRRHTIPMFVMTSALLASSVTAVAAAGPLVDDGSGSPERTPGLGGTSDRKVHRDRSLTSAPGANGRIVFTRSLYNDFPNALWTMDAAGSDIQRLTPDAGDWGDVYPAFSPGGTMVAFVRDMVAGTQYIEGDIWLIGADGQGPKRLTTTTAEDSAPEWTPDGARLVFRSNRTGDSEIYSMKIDGSDVRRLTTTAGYDGDPSVSPDGKKVAFASNRTGHLDIYTMNIDGTGVVRLTSAADDDYQPDWSPDGTKISFTSYRTGDAEIFAMSASGAGQTNLTDDPDFDDIDASWSPDGSKLVFWSWGTEDADMYVMASTGGVQELVGSSSTYDEWSPDWQPIPEFPLVDARFSTFKGDIEWVFNEGITKGCTAERYCPADAVTREQMAIFLDRALHLPTTSTDYFSDDTGRTGEAAINRVAAAGITSGCATGQYCPTDKVTRGAMASFLARAFALPSTATDYFTDDTGTTHESNINKVAAAGITSGCTPTTYCPSADVTRGQMAAFLRRALE